MLQMLVDDEGTVKAQTRHIRALGRRAPRFAEPFLRGPETNPSGRAALASYRHVDAFALLGFHNLWTQPQLFIFRSPLAYQSFCQQRKEELAIVCSFSDERAAARISLGAVSKVVRQNRRYLVRAGFFGSSSRYSRWRGSWQRAS